MAVTLAEWQARLDVLEEALVAGELSAGYKDWSVRYRSIPELERAIRYVQRKIESLSGQPVRAKQIRIVTRSGHHGRTRQR